MAAVPERLARRPSTGAGVIVVEPRRVRRNGRSRLVAFPAHATDLGLTWPRGLVAEVAASLATVPSPPGQRQHGTLPDARVPHIDYAQLSWAGTAATWLFPIFLRHSVPVLAAVMLHLHVPSSRRGPQSQKMTG